jgi:hypothetical protein
MNHRYTSLPSKISEAVKQGTELVGDDFTDEQLSTWFAQEREAYFEDDAGNSEEDPWYAYMRRVNERLGFSWVAREAIRPNAMLVLGPALGDEVVRFSETYPECKLSFLEASENFQTVLRKRFPGAVIVTPRFDGVIALPGESQDITLAFSVLHHIPNVSRVLAEIARVTRLGGLVLVREPCSSMGDWRFARSATPNERGISKALMLRAAARVGLHPICRPIPILFEPINTLLKKTIGFKRVPLAALYLVDSFVSRAVAINDHYWRDSWFKKFGPSSYFYVFRRTAEQAP